MPHPNLQPLFDQPILEQDEFLLDYEDRGSRVIRVRTSREHVVARTFRLNAPEGPFWGTLHALFGANPLVTAELATVHTCLGAVSPIPVPTLLRHGRAENRGWAVVELMPGSPLQDFADLTDAGLTELGRNLAAIHTHRYAALGSLSGSCSFQPDTFPERLVSVFRRAVPDHPDGKPVADMLEDMCLAASALPPPRTGVPAMPDLGPSQFLQHEGRVTAVVDIDAYVAGPPELDFVCLEFFTDERAASLIARGYGELLRPPPIASVRQVYRYLFRLLTVGQDVDLVAHMSWPDYFV